MGLQENIQIRNATTVSAGDDIKDPAFIAHNGESLPVMTQEGSGMFRSAIISCQ